MLGTPCGVAMADLIRLAGVRGRGFHGVFEHERRDGQEFVVDVELEADLSWAGASDALADTVNYGEIGALALAHIEGQPLDLIEALAERIAADVLGQHRLVDEVRVTVHKPQAPVGVPFGDVTVTVMRRRAPVPVVIAVGANLDNPAAAVTSAIDRLTGLLTQVRASSVIDTEPVGGPEQPAYANAVVVGRTRWSAPRLLRALHEIEAEAGRVRAVRWGPRTLDLDLIQWGIPGTDSEWLSPGPALLLPHPRAHERGFVVRPWLEADPAGSARVGNAVIPVAELAKGELL